MSWRNYPKEFLDRLNAVTNKRARIVIDHILQHGYVTTEELSVRYDYNHPPRAARDVREEGIPLETFRVKNANGKTIGAYRFSDSTETEMRNGRSRLPKKLKEKLIGLNGWRCVLCFQEYSATQLQVDHRIPYQIAGESDTEDVEQFMLVCRSCNRSKSWTCEHCPNALNIKEKTICHQCYWANPESYQHIATEEVRRLDLVWRGGEVKQYSKLVRLAKEKGLTPSTLVKKVLETSLEQSE